MPYRQTDSGIIIDAAVCRICRTSSQAALLIFRTYLPYNRHVMSMENQCKENTVTRESRSDLLTDSLWIFVAASLLHFGYSLTRFYPLSFICAVNESIWEHTKIVFFGALFYNLIQYLLKGKSSPCLIAGLAPALFSILVTVPFLYYGYTGMLGFYVFLLDLTIAWVSGLICQIILYRVSGIEGCSGYQTLSLLFVILLVLVFFLFTWYPPRGLPLFVPGSRS